MTTLLVVLAATAVVGLLWKALDGRLRARGGEDRRGVLAALGAEPGERATLLQFSSAACAPCRTTRAVLAGVAESEPGVVHVEVDAASWLDLVRELGVLKTPTTLVLDRHGREVLRASGPPRTDALRAALGSLTVLDPMLVERRAVDLCRVAASLCPLP